MEPVIVTIQNLEHPSEGRKSGSFRLPNGSYVKVRAKEMWKIAEGKTYNVEWEDSEFQGKNYHWLTKATLVEGSNGSTKAAPGKPQTYTRPDTSVTDSERIFVCGAFNNAMAHGQLDVRDVQAMVEACRNFREVFRQTWLNPQYAADMQDEVRF